MNSILQNGEIVKRLMKRLFSNIFIRIVVICQLVRGMFVLFGRTFLLFAGSRISAEGISVSLDILDIGDKILDGISWIVFVSGLIHSVIYGHNVWHDKSYWKNEVPEEENLVDEIKEDVYLLPIKYKNPVMFWVIGFLSCVSAPVLVGTFYFHLTISNPVYCFVFLLIEYVLIVLIVILVRALRRFRAFRVKKIKGVQKGDRKYVSQNGSNIS